MFIKNDLLEEGPLNAAEHVHSVDSAYALASVATLVRQHFPAASPNLNPWRDDPETRKWFENETIDLAFHFPGWSPRLECRSLLMQLTVSSYQSGASPHLMGVLIRGMTFAGERWRFATVGDWQPTGAYLPQPAQMEHLHEICRDIFVLFPSYFASSEVE